MRLFLSALMLCLSTFVSATTLNKFVVFGDSLSDNGNLYEYMKHQLPRDPPYYAGRFTNGPVWVELLIESYFPKDVNSHLLDYAFAGAAVADSDDDTLFTLYSQIGSYFLTHQDKADKNSLYMLWIGANDYLNIPDNLSEYSIENAVSSVNAGILHNLQRIADKGAKHVLVLNLPDLGRTPIARDFNAAAELTASSTQHNAMLKSNIEVLKKAYPDVQWMLFDIRSALDEMISNPAPYGFTNVTDTCYESAIEELSARSALTIASTLKVRSHNLNNACDGFLFFDPVHPSALAHRVLSERIRALLDEFGINFAD